MAPVAKRLTISFSDSISSRGTGPPFTPSLNSRSPRNVALRVLTSLAWAAKRQ